jgi:hypothetical protein
VNWEVHWEETPSNDFYAESFKLSIGSFEAFSGCSVQNR